MPVHLLATAPLEGSPLLLSCASESLVEIGWGTVDPLFVKVEVSQL